MTPMDRLKELEDCFNAHGQLPYGTEVELLTLARNALEAQFAPAVAPAAPKKAPKAAAAVVDAAPEA